MIFHQRTEAPDKLDEMYNSNANPYYEVGCGMPNCTAYTWSRLWEITGKKPSTIGVWNATDWYANAKANGWQVGSTPKLGAVICWQGAGSNSYGHVGIVEEIFEDGSVRVSESAWHGIYWNNGLIASPSNNYQHPTSANHYPCQGFIYCGIEFNGIDEPSVVRRSYIDILEREVDDNGFRTYVGVLQGGWTEADVRSDLTKSNENINDTNGWHKYWYVVRCYKVILGRFPENDDVINMWASLDKADIFDGIWNSDEGKKRRNAS